MSPAYNTTREDMAALWSALGLARERIHLVDAADRTQDLPAPEAGSGDVLVAQIGYAPHIDEAVKTYRGRSDRLLGRDGTALFYLKDERPAAELARWRNELWPWLHVVAIVHLAPGEVSVQTLHGHEKKDIQVARKGYVLVGRRREHVLSQANTVEKFDKNAAGWNPQPGSPGYAHFRWMRQFVGRFAATKPGARILDFGCGAGWVGIEAAITTKDATLCMFDPSPELAKSAEDNARAAGVKNVTVRTGFGEQPPFPAAGEAPFDLVLSSGVISFAPDADTWLDGLCRTLAPGATLVIGDIHRDSRGMQKRRARKVLLPAREMNALTPNQARALLEKRGFKLVRAAGYQLTSPWPEAMHVSDTKLGGSLTPLILTFNRMRAGSTNHAAFDSWVMSLTAPG